MFRGCKKFLSYLYKRAKLEYALLANKPYLGPIFIANQIWTEREPLMKNLISSELKNTKTEFFKVLEIGTWAGSSAMLWATECKKYNKGMVFCVDTWQLSPNFQVSEMREGLKNDKIFRLFLHNLKARQLENLVIPIRCESNIFAKIVKLQLFDFVYIDGDHGYNQFKQDLENFSEVVKIGGIICGDDLELMPQDIDIDYARKNHEIDFIEDPKTRKHYHPGIALGISDFFGETSMKNGFWAMRKTKNGWEKIEL